MDNQEVEDFIQHHRVKGMKWGVRKDGKRGSSSGSKSSQNGNKTNGLVGQAKALVGSKKRELQLAKTLKDFDNLSTNKAKSITNRARLENNMKRLSGTKNVGDNKSKSDYLNRASMSTQELKRKTDRLQLKDNMRMETRAANQGAIDLGKKAIAIAAPIAVQLVVKKSIDRKWLDTKLNPVNMDIGDYDAIGKQAAKWVDELI